MSGREQSAGVKRDEEEVVYSGSHIVVVKDERFGLVAYPHEVPKGREKEYLLLMLDELQDVFDGLREYTGDGLVFLSAAAVYGGEAFELEVDKDIGVLARSEIKDYVKFIKTADKVTVKFADKDVGLYYNAYRGRRIVVVKGRWYTLYALARSDVWENRVMDPTSLMLTVIREVMSEKDELVKKWGYKAVAVRGRVWRNTVPFVPVIYGRNAVDLEPLYKNYVKFVRMADEVKLFPRR